MRGYTLSEKTRKTLIALNEKEHRRPQDMAKEAFVFTICMKRALCSTRYRPSQENHMLLTRYANKNENIKPLKSIKVLICEVLYKTGWKQKELSIKLGHTNDYINHALSRMDKRGNDEVREKLEKILKDEKNIDNNI